MTQTYESRLDSAAPLEGVEMGIGAWAWGDTTVWGFGSSYSVTDVRSAYEGTLQAGINLFDTAEIYGRGESERLLGKFMRETNTRPKIATKFAPMPWRFTRGQFLNALRGSLRRLGLDSVDLYQVHFPTPLVPVERWAEAMADAVEAGLAKAVGVSNFNAEQTRRVHAVLAKRGIPLTSNQVDYSLLERDIERDGTMKTCDELGVKIIAYSPLAMGLLTGKYTPGSPMPGFRGMKYRKLTLKAQSLISLMKEIGQRHGGKTPAQVALNWTICKGTLPIPGAKNARQAQQNAGALGWRLTPDDIAALDVESMLVAR